jgi:hypothetical protein
MSQLVLVLKHSFDLVTKFNELPVPYVTEKYRPNYKLVTPKFGCLICYQFGPSSLGVQFGVEKQYTSYIRNRLISQKLLNEFHVWKLIS